MPALDATELLALMDLNMTAVYAADTRATPGGEVVETSGLFMCRTPHGTVGTNMAIVTGSIDVATVRRLCREMYGADGTPFSVWTREHVDAALARELEADGFLPIHREPGMVLLPEAWERAPVPPDAEVRAVHDAEEYGRVAAAAFGVYGVPDASVTEHFETAASVSGPETQAYLAYRDGRAVAGAILYMAHGVGGIGWVATLPAEFGRGYGRAVTRAVIEDGFARGARFMNLQASPMGELMYRRMGFTTPTHYRWFLASP
jgi:ribosomal protein S18 acetylase RimI-like enzyme